MIQRLDVDLAAGSPTGIEGGGRAWVLVRSGTTVLGEIEIEVGALPPGQNLREMLTRRFASELLWVSRFARTGGEPTRDAGPVSFTVVVEAGGRPDREVDACLAAIAALEPGPLEVLVTGRVGEGAPGAEARLLMERNESLDQARGEAIVFFDPNCLPHPWFLGAMSRALSRPDVGSVIPVFTPHELETKAQVAFHHRILPRRRLERRLWSKDCDPDFDPVSAHPGIVGGIAHRRVALQAAGGFPSTEITTRLSEFEVLARIMEAGWVVQSEPDAEIRHIHPRTRSEARDWLTAFVGDRTEFRRAHRHVLPPASVVTKALRRARSGDLDVSRRITSASASARLIFSSAMRGPR